MMPVNDRTENDRAVNGCVAADRAVNGRAANTAPTAPPRLRDMIVTHDGLIFAVCDYFHPENGVRAVLRYVPDASGPRVCRTSGKRYRKTDFDEAMAYVSENRPEWMADVPIVPYTEIAEIRRPGDVIPALLCGEIDHPAALSVVRAFSDAGIPEEAMGITGSILAGLNDGTSDIDFLVYGKEWHRARTVLETLKRGNVSGIRDPDAAMWRRIYAKRRPPVDFDTFLAHEIRKGNRGMIGTVYFDLLFVRSSDMILTPPPRGKDTVRAEVSGIVSDDSFSFDSPAVFRLVPNSVSVSPLSGSLPLPPIAEIFSYTHTYAGQAVKGETILACGIVEDLGGTARLVVGTRREPQDEWIRSLSLEQNRKETGVSEKVASASGKDVFASGKGVSAAMRDGSVLNNETE